MNLTFVSEGMLGDGGMPNDLRSLVTEVAACAGGEVRVIADQRRWKQGALSGVEIIHAAGLRDAYRIQLGRDETSQRYVLVGFSSLFNVIVAFRLRLRGLKYSIMPAWQIHPFLDRDNPFEKRSVPSIENLLRNVQSKRIIFSRVRNGSGGGMPLFRSLLRRTYRKTLGRWLLNNADVIHVFSTMERQLIQDLVRPRHTTYQLMHLGTDASSRPVGNDTFPSGPYKNIVFWGRADYYYKGLDIVLDALAEAISRGTAAPLKLWIIGPDYNGGHANIRRHLCERGIEEYVQILPPGTYSPGTLGLLQRADFCIACSRWHGFCRTLRESLCLGVPVITNRETHFDDILRTFKNGFIFENQHELIDILVSIGSPEADMVSRTAKANQAECVRFFRWSKAGVRFVESLTTPLVGNSRA